MRLKRTVKTQAQVAKVGSTATTRNDTTKRAGGGLIPSPVHMGYCYVSKAYSTTIW
jgi:hypothetical protein